MIEFCVETYLPAIRTAVSHVQLEGAQRERMQGLVKGTGMKLLYAFVWQVKFNFFYWKITLLESQLLLSVLTVSGEPKISPNLANHG